MRRQELSSLETHDDLSDLTVREREVQDRIDGDTEISSRDETEGEVMSVGEDLRGAVSVLVRR